jgi:hypothetical protein
MGRRSKKDGWQEEYALRRLLGAVLVEAVLDALSQDAGWKDKTSALAFLRDANVRALCDAHLALPPGLWRAFAEAADRGVEIDLAVVEGLESDRLASASPPQQSKALTQQSATLTGQTIVAVEKGNSPEPAAQPALPGGLIGLMRRVQQAVGRPVAAGAG